MTYEDIGKIQDFNNRFPGLEFDWFALDAEGSIGLFSTAGFGPVPTNVQLHFRSHDQTVRLFDLYELEKCGRYGLFVFDWQHWQGPYLKMEQPRSPVAISFKQHILQIPSLPIFNMVFASVESIVVEESDKL
jgi:hypothetical protein